MADAWQVTNVCNWPIAEWRVLGSLLVKADARSARRFGW
jgi:hypothetical protein